MGANPCKSLIMLYHTQVTRTPPQDRNFQSIRESESIMPPGPRPKPTILKKLAGNPGKRKLNTKEPQFSGVASCPNWLTPHAKTEWKRVTVELATLDMLRSVDSSALGAYCQSFARWRSAELIVGEGRADCARTHRE
jgi:hypothetical protein